MTSTRSGSIGGPAIGFGSTPGCSKRRRSGRYQMLISTMRMACWRHGCAGLRSHRVAGGLDRSLDDLLYAYEWRPQPRSEADVAPQELSWLILADRCGAGAQLARQLRAAGDPCTVVRPGGRVRGLRRWTIPDQPGPARGCAGAVRFCPQAQSGARLGHRSPGKPRRAGCR